MWEKIVCVFNPSKETAERWDRTVCAIDLYYNAAHVTFSGERSSSKRMRYVSQDLSSSVSTVCHTFLWCWVHVGGDVESGEYRRSPRRTGRTPSIQQWKTVKHKYRYCNVHAIIGMHTSILSAGRVLAAFSPLMNKYDRFPWHCLMRLRCSLKCECGHCGRALYVCLACSQDRGQVKQLWDEGTPRLIPWWIMMARWSDKLLPGRRSLALSLADHSRLPIGLCIQSQQSFGCRGNFEAEVYLIMLIQETDKEVGLKNLKPLETHTHTLPHTRAEAVCFIDTACERNNETFVRVSRQEVQETETGNSFN